MAYSYIEYTADGNTFQFSIPFPYIERSHVLVKVDGAAATFSWISSSVIQLAEAPAAQSVVRVYRSTPKATRMVNFTNGSVLRESILDKDANQMFYTMQEVYDSFQELLPVIETIGELLEYGAASLGSNSFTGNQSIEGNLDMNDYVISDATLDGVILKDYGEELVTVTGTSGNVTIDTALGNTFLMNIGGNTVFTFQASNTCRSFTLIMDLAGLYSITWPTSVEWAQGVAPTLSENYRDVLVFFTFDGGTTWIGGVAFDACR